MTNYTDQYSKKVNELQASGITARIADIDAHLNQHFSLGLDEAANVFKTSLPANTQLSLSSNMVRESLARASEDVSTYMQWIQLKVPHFEDGGNFGLQVQHEVKKHLEGNLEKINSALDAIPEYFEKRSAAVEKIANKTSTENKVTTSQTSSTGGKDGNEEKTNNTKTEERSTRASEPLHDQLEAVVAIDLKYYLIFRRNLEMIKGYYITIHDVVSKNYERLDAPRGKRTSGSHLSMF